VAKEKNETMDKLVSLGKRKGFVFQSSEIYGGLNSCWDYGPLGVELKRNIQDTWWTWMTQLHDNIDGLDASILMHPKVWEASGHIDSFTDPLVDCNNCKQRFREDQLDDPDKCPNCGKQGTLTESRQFNLMFKTHMGPLEDAANAVYLRPETAQGIYVDYLVCATAMRRKLPFGIAQVGKAFRNEITPGNFIFRTREFEQMEMQFFVKPGTDMEWYEQWKQERFAYYPESLGVDSNKIRLHEHGPDELAHYAKVAYDIEYEFPFGWAELEGIHHRTDYDLTRHQEFSGKDMTWFDEAAKERFHPYIVETSAGLNRTLLVVMCDAFDEDDTCKDVRSVLRFHPRLAPVKAAIFPLMKRDGMPEVAHNIEKSLKSHFRVQYDEGGSVGRRYRRMDEVGTPYCITVDSQTLEDQTVTIRDRDSMEQERYLADNLATILHDRIDSWQRPAKD